VLLQQGFLPRIMCIPDGQDPDDYLSERPDEAVLKLASEARDPIRFALGLLDGWSSVQGTQRQVKVVQRLAGIASAATEPVIRETLLRIISEETGYSMETLELELQEKEKSGGRKSGDGVRTRETGRKRSDGGSDTGGPADGSGLSGWDTRLLAGMLLSPMGLADPLIEFLEPEDLRSSHAAEILSEIKRQLSTGLSAFQLSGLQEPQRSICARILSVHPERTAPEDQERLMTAVEKARLQRERRELRERQRSGDAGEDVRRRIAEIEDRIKNM
jgi:DNA primase